MTERDDDQLKPPWEEERLPVLHDVSTKLADRRLIEERTGQALNYARRKRLVFSLACFRVDGFSAIATSLGSDDTRRLLENLGRRLRYAGRAEDTLAYLGEGMFAALLPGAAGPAEAAAAVGSILPAVGGPVRIRHHELSLTVSLGVAIYPSDGTTVRELLENAEAAMHRASAAGGERWQFFHAAMNEERVDKLALSAELQDALAEGRFTLVYQPLVALTDESTLGVEALLRWLHPERGVLAPLDFLPVAEESGVMLPIGAWVLEEACRQGREWERSLGRRLRMVVNLSGRELHAEPLVGTVRQTLRTTGFDPRSLELDITETAAMQDPRHTAQVLGAFKAMGVRVALDDFGTGYSSLTHLVRLGAATIKIDRSLVHGMLGVPEQTAVAAAVITLGKRMGVTVVAEGVETTEERDVLREEGCDAVQGFLWGEPLPAGKCAELLVRGRLMR
jgi:diguanylate cyclase (GGDEF)-like protein